MTAASRVEYNCYYLKVYQCRRRRGRPETSACTMTAHPCVRLSRPAPDRPSRDGRTFPPFIKSRLPAYARKFNYHGLRTITVRAAKLPDVGGRGEDGKKHPHTRSDRHGFAGSARNDENGFVSIFPSPLRSSRRRRPLLFLFRKIQNRKNSLSRLLHRSVSRNTVDQC